MCKNYYYKVAPSNSCGANPIKPNTSNMVHINQEFENVFTSANSFSASKGYYNNKVLLEWQINSNYLADISSYEIFRKKIGQEFTFLTSINNPNASSYDDLSADANDLYQYFIRAVGQCAGTTIYSDTAYVVGYRVKTGIVSGKITYAGGNAVNNVPVRIASEDPITATSGNFTHPNAYAISSKFRNDSLFHKAFTVEMWIRTDNNYDDSQFCFSILDGLVHLGLDQKHPTFVINQKSMHVDYVSNQTILSLTGDTLLNSSTWYHLAASIDIDNNFAGLYLNGKLVASQNIDFGDTWIDVLNCDLDFNNPDLIIGNAFAGCPINDFHGYIDEIRIWQ
jgi:hypothetical protein